MTDILFINEFYHPDICASAAVLADRLPRIKRLRPDWELTVIASARAWDRPDVIYDERERHGGIQILRVHRPALKRSSLLRRAVGFAAFQRGAVRAAARLGSVDLVVGTTAPPQGAGIARRIARRHRCPYVYCVFDLYPDLAATLGRVGADSFIYRRWLGRDTRNMRDAARVVCIAEEMKDRVARTRGVDAGKLAAIHDGFDPVRVAPPSENANNQFARAHNSTGRFVVQYAGNMGLSHPFETILAAARALAGERDILFQFIGDGPHRKQVAANLPDNAQLIDYQPANRLWEVLRTADVCLISQHEDMFDKALPYKVYGILAAGRPAIFIGNERCEIAQWLAEADAGRCVRHGDVNGLVEAIRFSKSNRDEASAMGRRGRELLDERFGAQQAAEQWATLLDSVLVGR